MQAQEEMQLELAFLPLIEAGPIQWTDNEVFQLQESLIYQGLSVLKSHRTSKLEKLSILRWVFRTEVSPFSFVSCCHSCGYDAEEIRDQLRAYVGQVFDCVTTH